MTDVDRENLLAKMTQETRDKVPGYTAMITEKGVESVFGNGIGATLATYGAKATPQVESRDFALVAAYHEQQAKTVPVGVINYVKAFFEQLLGFKNDAPTNLDPNMGFLDRVYARAGELVAYETSKDAANTATLLALNNDPNIANSPEFKDKVGKFEKAIYSIAYKAAMEKVGHPVSDTEVAAAAEKAQHVASNDVQDTYDSGLPAALGRGNKEKAIG